MADEQKLMSPEEAAALASQAPPHRDLGTKDGPEGGGGAEAGVVESAEVADKADMGKGAEPLAQGEHEKEGGEASQEELVPLPSDIQVQFPDVDLSGVTVVLNSPQAEEKGVDGFALGTVIHVAPNVADQKAVLRHEAAHVVQQMKGDETAKREAGEELDKADASELDAAKGADGEGQEGQGEPAGQEKGQAAGPAAAEPEKDGGAPQAELEGEASAAEGGQATPETALSAAPTGEAQNRETETTESRLPAASFTIENGAVRLDSIAGEISQDILEAEWQERTIFEGNHTFRFPAFPVAGVYVAAGVAFKPSASLSIRGQYSWNAGDREYSVTGAIVGSISGALTGYVEGGAALDAVIQAGGVGLRGSLTASATASVSRSVRFTYKPGQGFNWAVTPFDIDIAAQLQAALTLRSWTRGWFSNKAWEWTFANLDIAYLTGGKVMLEMGSRNGRGAGVTFAGTRPGRVGWGSPPAPTERNGRRLN